MISTKYTKDYSVSYELSARGRLVPTAIYSGSYYRFAAEPEAVAAARKRLLLLLIPSVLVLIALLSTNLAYPKDAQVWLLPVFFSLIPMAFVILGTWRVFTVGETFIHKRRDQIENRFPPALLFYMLFCAAGFVTSVIAAVISGVTVWKLLYAAGVLVQTFLAVLLFRQRGSWRTVELPKAEQDEEAESDPELSEPDARKEPDSDAEPSAPEEASN